jgi:hypothetical protein
MNVKIFLQIFPTVSYCSRESVDGLAFESSGFGELNIFFTKSTETEVLDK